MTERRGEDPGHLYQGRHREAGGGFLLVSIADGIKDSTDRYVAMMLWAIVLELVGTEAKWNKVERHGSSSKY